MGEGALPRPMNCRMPASTALVRALAAGAGVAVERSAAVEGRGVRELEGIAVEDAVARAVELDGIVVAARAVELDGIVVEDAAARAIVEGIATA